MQKKTGKILNLHLSSEIGKSSAIAMKQPSRRTKTMVEEKVSRRNFFKQLVAVGVVAGIGGAVGSITGAYLAPRPEPKPERVLPARIPTPPMALGAKRTRVSLEKFDAITQDAYMKATTRLIDALGRDNFRKMVYGKRVVLKPNWVNPSGDPKRTQSDNTNPYLLRALAIEAHDSGARKVIFGESPAYGSYTQSYDRLYLNAANKENMGGGIVPIKEPPEVLEFVELGNFNWEKTRWIDVPNPYAMPKVVQPESLYGSDVVLISIPTLKPHSFARISVGLKNVGIGCQPSTSYACISATSKDATTFVKDAKDYLEKEKAYHDFCETVPVAEWRARAIALYLKSRGHAWAASGFAEMHPELPQVTHTYGDGRVKKSTIILPESNLYVHAQIADVIEVNPISMTVVDVGVTDEQGITGYTPVDNKAKIGSYFLIGGYDPVAVDAFAARMMGWETPFDIWPGIAQLHFCEQKGMGTKDLNRIEVLYEGKNYPGNSILLPMLGYGFAPVQTYQSPGDVDVIWRHLDILDKLGPPSIPSGLEAV